MNIFFKDLYISTCEFQLHSYELNISVVDLFARETFDCLPQITCLLIEIAVMEMFSPFVTYVFVQQFSYSDWQIKVSWICLL